ncbi:MAG: VOC family protein [Shewanella sp.]|nr:VOC family protein [Shewanella sp.]MCF1430526.1 VOC family protein [Shewanella sp.]MCF1457437.1 VOC family protein [Shewanella sp.]
MERHNCINYIEMPVRDLDATKAFFTLVFGWQFVDCGPHYSCFTNAGINGGFYQDALTFNVNKGSPLIVLFSQQLEQTQSAVENAGGEITKAIFRFPGGRRFHFADPNGNEYAVWGHETGSG